MGPLYVIGITIASGAAVWHFFGAPTIPWDVFIANFFWFGWLAFMGAIWGALVLALTSELWVRG